MELQDYSKTQSDGEHNFGLEEGKDGLVIGKMFGVLVVKNQENELGYICSFSGKLTGHNQHVRKSQNNQAIDLTLIDKAFDISINEDEEAFISKVGLSLRKIDPRFDPRTFAFKTLTPLFEKIDKYQIIKNEVNGLNHPLVKLK